MRLAMLAIATAFDCSLQFYWQCDEQGAAD
jgi:hypothetical protein